MKAFPIIPIWIMVLISIIYIKLVIKTKTTTKLVIRLLIILVVFIINLRFMVLDDNAEAYTSDLDIIIVVDNSISMNAEDYNGNNTRLSAVKDDLNYILDKIPSARYSIITFDSKSYIKTPLTTDRDAINYVIYSMEAKKSLYSDGSDLTIYKDDLKYILEKSKEKENHKRIVLLISDGEQTSENKIESLYELKKYIDGGAVLGYGTAIGGEMKEKKSISSDEYEYLEDRREKYPYPHAISKINENNLKKFANNLGIDYIHMTKQNNIDNEIKKIINLGQLGEKDNVNSYKDTYYPLAFILSILLIIELYIDKREYL